MRRQYRDEGYQPRSEVRGHQTHLFKKTGYNTGAPGDACAEGELIENRCFSLLLFCGPELRNQTAFFLFLVFSRRSSFPLASELFLLLLLF